MEVVYILLSVVQAVAISLGVGCSTAAIFSFFTAIKDSKIDKSERRMLGVIYILLRVAMGLILVITSAMALIIYSMVGLEYWHTLHITNWILIVVLFLNAILMTKHIMTSSIGPGIQASAWYTLGIINAIPISIMMAAPLVTVVAWYLLFTVCTVALVYVFVKKFNHTD